MVSSRIAGIFVALAFVSGAFIASPELRAYAAATITSADIVDATIRSVDIGSGEVKASDIGNGQVTSAKIKDGNVMTSDLANDAVTSDKLADNVFDDLQAQIDALTAENAAQQMEIDDLTSRVEALEAGAGTSDFDGDGLDDSLDNCPAIENPLQFDNDEDDIGDACDGITSVLVGTGTGSNLAIPDQFDGYDGTIETMGTSQLTVSAELSKITNLKVIFGANHGHVGDLTLKLQSPTGTLVDLVVRPGADDTDPLDVSAGAGESSDLASTHPITFDDLAFDVAEDMGVNVNSDQAICKDHATCEFSPSTYFNQTPDALQQFNGEDPSGIWTLYFVNDVGDGGGTVDQWKLDLSFSDLDD